MRAHPLNQAERQAVLAVRMNIPTVLGWGLVLPGAQIAVNYTALLTALDRVERYCQIM